MEEYIFFFGRSPELSFAELSAFVPTLKKNDVGASINAVPVFIDGREIAIPDLLAILGGTTRIGRAVNKLPAITPQEIAHALSKPASSSVTFGLSSFSSDFKVTNQFLSEVKRILAGTSHHVRFILPRHGETLSTAGLGGEVQELCVIGKTGNFTLSQTIAAQPIDQWVSRDIRRPYIDAKRGMLPPKVARMMVNIGFGNDSRGKTLLDPFCGMGTIAMESFLRGVRTIASDLSVEVVEKAKKNIATLKDTKEVPPVSFHTSDATHVSSFLLDQKIDVVVTEPFMGTAKLGEGKIFKSSEIRNIMKGLEKLYIGCLREWKSILTDRGVVVIALPEIDWNARSYGVKKVIDRCEMYGYTKVLGPLPYSRPQAVVRRMIYVLKTGHATRIQETRKKVRK